MQVSTADRLHLRPTRWVAWLTLVLSFLAWMVVLQRIEAADPITYTFTPKNESGDPAKGWYIHLPPPFVAADVVIKDSGGKTLKDVRVIDRGQRTGVTVLFETDGAGVANNATDTITLTLVKPLGKTGTSGFRDKPGVKGIPIGEATYNPPWTDSKGGKGGTQPKEEKKRQEAPPESDEEDRATSDDSGTSSALVNPLGDQEPGPETGDASPELGSDYPYSSEETNDELFGEWADSFGPDESALPGEELEGEVQEASEPTIGAEIEPAPLFPPLQAPTQIPEVGVVTVPRILPPR